jgi:ubiquinone/menaquinone biosynthesis C-methylase UbiE
MPEPARPTPAEEYERVLVPGMFVPCTQLLLQRAAPGSAERVLDLACGTGIVARTVAARIGSGGSIVALDPMPGMLAVARSRPPADGAPIEWREGDAAALDFGDNTFDLVLCQQGLQFFPDRPKALAEARRVLKNGGRIALAVWRGREAQPLFDAMCEVELRHLAPLGVTREEIEAFLSLGDADEIRRLLADAGFSNIKISSDAVDADFNADTFVRDADYAYSAFMPSFRENPAAFDEFIAAVERDMAPVLKRYRVGSRLRFPVPVHIATALA